MPGSAIGINHLTGSVASLVAPTTTSMWPLKDVCCLVALFVHLAFAFAFRGWGRGHCKLKSKSVSPATGNWEPATTTSSASSRQRSSSSRACAHPLACHHQHVRWLAGSAFVALQANLLRSALSLSLSRILFCARSCSQLRKCPGRPQTTVQICRVACANSLLFYALHFDFAPAKGRAGHLQQPQQLWGAPRDTASRSSGNAAEIIISACHICFSTLLLCYFSFIFACAISKGLARCCCYCYYV